MTLPEMRSLLGHLATRILRPEVAFTMPPAQSGLAAAPLTPQGGDVVTMRTPRGTEELEIIVIRYDELR